MKKIKYIAFSVCVLCSVLCAPVQAQDYTRLSEHTLMGTARYVGMSGAMSAIGGDPSAVLDNPAGLGLYQRTEVLLTFDETIDYTRQIGTSNKHVRSHFMCPQASIVISLPTFTVNPSGVQSFNFMLGYRRMHAYNRTFDAVGKADASLGALLPDFGLAINRSRFNTANALLLKEWGYSNEYSFDWSMNIGHRWYLGLGLHIQDYMFSANAVYTEAFDTISAEGSVYANRNDASLQFSGASCNLSAGVIYRPLQWLRFGFGLQTPSIGTIHAYTSGVFRAQTDSLRFSYAPDLRYDDRSFHLPLHLSTSAAFQFGAYGMLSLQYDYYHAKGRDDIHSLRAGLEVVPVMGFYLNAGYAMESTFKSTTPAGIDPSFDRQDTYSVLPRWSQYASCAIGYRGTYVMVQAAYQYRWQHMDLYAHEAAQPYNMRTDTHRIVLTIGWHKN